MPDRLCRCGLTYPADTLGLINHVASAEHAERVKSLPPVHNHSDKDWNNAPRVRPDCPACRYVVDPLVCNCGHRHSSGTDGEDAGCLCHDGHDWTRADRVEEWSRG